MAGYENYNGVFLPLSTAYSRQIWANGENPLYGPDTPTQLMGSNAGNYLYGGAADDTIYAIHTGDRISGGGGVDTAYATVNFTIAPDVENLTMDAHWSPVLGIGNDNANILTAATAQVTLEGGGDDVIISAGGDTFVFNPGSGADVLVNFQSASDVLRIGGYDLNSFDEVKGAMVEVGADTLLKLSADDLILFKGVNVADFTADNFQLSIDPTALKPTFADEFNSLKLQQLGDAKGWSAAYAWDRYGSESAHTIWGESEIYVDPTYQGSQAAPLGLNPFAVSDGVLTINATATSDADKAALWGHDYTSGVITTAGSFSQTYGYFEMRADLPSGAGAFPAFWLLSDDGKYNEIDVMEAVNGGDAVWNHLHYTAAAGDADRSGVGFSATVPDLADGFHTFGLLWTPQTITWYVDEVAVNSTPTPAALNSPMYMLANYAVGGSWAGAPDGEALSPMKIDYIRAYSLDAVEAGGVPTAATGPVAPVAVSEPHTAPVASNPVVVATAPVNLTSLSISSDGEIHVAEDSVAYAKFTVARSGPLDGPTTAVWTTSGSGAHPADATDFGGDLPKGVVYFGGGEATKSIWVAVTGASAQPSEQFAVTLSNPAGAVLGGDSAETTIVNDHPVAATPVVESGPTLSVSADATQHEGTGWTSYALFTVNRGGQINGPSTAEWSVTGTGAHPADGADFGGDLPSGKVYFGGGESVKTIWVSIAGDSWAEADEGFTLTLAKPTGADLEVASASTMLADDDSAHFALVGASLGDQGGMAHDLSRAKPTSRARPDRRAS